MFDCCGAVFVFTLLTFGKVSNLEPFKSGFSVVDWFGENRLKASIEVDNLLLNSLHFASVDVILSSVLFQFVSFFLFMSS